MRALAVDGVHYQGNGAVYQMMLDEVLTQAALVRDDEHFTPKERPEIKEIQDPTAS